MSLCFNMVVLIETFYDIYLFSCQFSHCVTKNNLVYLICKRVRFLWLLQNTGGKQLERLLLTHLFRGFNPQLLGSAVFRPMAKGNAMPGSCLLHGG